MSDHSATPDMDRIRETLKKLATLAERGEENERQTALEMLQKLLQKYGLSLKDLIDPDLKNREFNYESKDNLTVLAQCIWSVNQDAQISFDPAFNKVIVPLSTPDYIEALEKVRYFYPLYEKEKMKLMLAFICKHGLTTSLLEGKPVSEISREEAKQVALMMEGMGKGMFVSTRKMVDKK